MSHSVCKISVESQLFVLNKLRYKEKTLCSLDTYKYLSIKDLLLYLFLRTFIFTPTTI